MEIPLSGFHYDVVIDQIRSFPRLLDPTNIFRKSNETKISLLHGFDFSFNARRKRRATTHLVSSSATNSSSSSSAQQGLRPRPTLKPRLNDGNNNGGLSKIRNLEHYPGICKQIEKFVFYERYEQALELFEVLEIESGFDAGVSTLDGLVEACIELKSIRGVKRVYRYMADRSSIVLDQYMRNRVLLMHVKCGMMVDGRKLFDDMPERNAVSWITLIWGLGRSGEYKEAFKMSVLMLGEFLYANPHMFSLMIGLSASLGYVSAGRQLHCCVLKMGLDVDNFVSCSLVNMYSKLDRIEDAQIVFHGMPIKNAVAWNSIIAGYAHLGYSEEALSMFDEMRASGVKPDSFTYSCVVRLCTRLASLDNVKQVHADLVRHGFGSYLIINTALVDFYSKWGSIEDARRVFEEMPRKNVMSWNALIDGYANHGRATEAVEIFERMILEGVIPNHVTFRAVLCACSHSGLSDRGREIFESMTRDHKIKPRAMHYACMIELLGKEGLLDEAFSLIRDAPFSPTKNMWAALLTACRVHKNLELGELSAKNLCALEPKKLSNYFVLLNIYNSSGRSKEAAEVINTMERLGLKIRPVHSWIDIKKQPHFFHSGDISHPQFREIYDKVDKLMLAVARHGYVPADKPLLPDVDKCEEHISPYHSEKLAIACGIINTPDSTSLQVVQDHRICGDCHNVIKLITSVTRRNIVVRDASRFHHFKDGFCSCKDYW